MLFNEPKLLKCNDAQAVAELMLSFSALQRAEIAEITRGVDAAAEILVRFSALQRAEIAEIITPTPAEPRTMIVSVLFNEPKLLKWRCGSLRTPGR